MGTTPAEWFVTIYYIHVISLEWISTSKFWMTGLLDDIIKKLDPGKTNKINFDQTFNITNP